MASRIGVRFSFQGPRQRGFRLRWGRGFYLFAMPGQLLFFSPLRFFVRPSFEEANSPKRVESCGTLTSRLANRGAAFSPVSDSESSASCSFFSPALPSCLLPLGRPCEASRILEHRSGPVKSDFSKKLMTN